MGTNRLAWADVMKGIGIIAVVVGHIYGELAHKFIFAFHMPLFFFIGGYFFRLQPNKAQYLKNQSKKLLIPYSIFLLIIYFSVNFKGVIHSNTWYEILVILAKPIVGGRALVGYTSVFWFITVYFLLQQLANLIFPLKKSCKIALILFLYGLGLINSIWFPQFWLPWNINVVCAAFPLFYLGYLFNKEQFKFNRLLLVFITFFALGSIYFIENNSYDMKYAQYGIPILTLSVSCVLIIFIKEFSVLISGYRVSSLLAPLGKASLIIMYLHFPVILICRQLFQLNPIFIVILALAAPLVIYHLFQRFGLTRRYLLGYYK